MIIYVIYVHTVFDSNDILLGSLTSNHTCPGPLRETKQDVNTWQSIFQQTHHVLRHIGEDGNNASLLMLLRKFTSFSWCICQYIFISHKKYGTVSISSLAIRYEKVWRPKGLISETLSVTTTENEEMEPKQNKHHLPCLHAWIQFILSNICFFEGGVNIWTLYKKHHLRKDSEDINIVVFLPPVLKPFSTFPFQVFFSRFGTYGSEDWTPLVGIIWFQPPHSGRWEKILVEGNG